MAINLPKLTKQQQQFLVVGVLAAGALGFVYIKYFWLPTSARIDAARTTIEKLSKDIQTAKNTAARKPKLLEELSMLNQAALEAEKRLPRTKSVPDILVTLQTLAKKYDVSLSNFTPQGTRAQTYYIELVYPVSIRGTCHNVGKFLASIAIEERLYNVSNVNLANADEKGIMTVTFVLTSYQYKG
ncbi:MAG: type 4a pilus biogenesis protein PilO [Elusimicrobia bacterium]|nr:type 4a pilus biogenesis protein PilO [Elusimicrobiota bacterium]